MKNISTETQRATSPVAAPRYTIYTYARVPGGERADRWQRHGSLAERGKALRIARNLFASGRYARIEIKHQIVGRDNRRTDATLRSFGRNGGLRFGMSGIALFAGLCSVTVLLVAALI